MEAHEGDKVVGAKGASVEKVRAEEGAPLLGGGAGVIEGEANTILDGAGAGAANVAYAEEGEGRGGGIVGFVKAVGEEGEEAHVSGLDAGPDTTDAERVC